nr:helix-turn-helix domain-containing protein [uncultured Dyadobacter sp.]
MAGVLLNTATVSCLIFLAVLAISKESRNSTGYRLLGLLFILLSFDFVDEALAATGSYSGYPALAVVLQPVLFAFAPLVYLSVFYLTTVSQRLSAKLVYHFIPYLIVLALYLDGYVFTDQDQATLATIAASTGSEPVEIVLISLFFIQVIVYQYHSLKTLNRHRKKLPLFVSNLPDNDYHWLFNATIGLSALFAVSFAEVVFDHGQKSAFFPLIYLCGFYYVGIQVTKQKEVFAFPKEQSDSFSDLLSDDPVPATLEAFPELPDPDIPNQAVENATQVKKKTISDEKLEAYQHRLLEIMELQKPYMDSEITLPKLGKILLLNTYQTSYLINSSFGENFYTFINRYRLEECKRMLSHRSFDHMSILSIAYESGFNSKTAFNTAFKKNTGCSPSEFRELNCKGSA